jgi:ring-1,2-phenylacetyl-CoA epoxidase subunit PaaD
MRQMALDIEEALAPRYGAVRVQTHLSPAWSTDWITPEAREKLRAWGIAPPVSTVGGSACGAGAPAPGQALQFALRATSAEPVPCPRCGSAETMAVAQFGSTACKALYRCLACHEPFDYFKPY